MQAYEAIGPSDEEIKKAHQVSTPGQRVGFMRKLQAESLSTRAETKNLPMIELTPLYVSPPEKKKSVSFKLGDAHEKGYFMGEVFHVQ